MLLDELASMVGVSRFHLNRHFKGRTGDTPRMYLEKVRVQKAKELLLTTTLNNTEIGYQVGVYRVFTMHLNGVPGLHQVNFKLNMSHRRLIRIE